MDWFQVFVMKGSNTMRTRNSPKLPGSATTPPINNVHSVCKPMVFNLKTSFSIPSQVTLHRLLNVFLQNLQRHRRYISDPSVWELSQITNSFHHLHPYLLKHCNDGLICCRHYPSIKDFFHIVVHIITFAKFFKILVDTCIKIVS